MRTILCLFIAIMLAASASATDGGTYFTFAFPPNFRDTQSSELQLSLAVYARDSASIRINAVGVMDTTLSIPADVPYRIAIPSSVVRTTEDGVFLTPIEVTSSTPIQITALSHRYQTTDAFTVLPEEMYGTEYILASYDRLPTDDGGFQSQCSITTLSEAAVITVHRADTLLYQYSIPAESSILIEARWDLDDLTGCKISSSSPISVVTGHACAFVPKHVEACNTLLEHAVPVGELGRRYVLPAHPATVPIRIRLIAGRYPSKVWFGDTRVELRVGSFVELEVIDEHLFVHGDQPFMVAVYTTGFKHPLIDDEQDRPDPSMVILPPIEAGDGVLDVVVPVLLDARVMISVMGEEEDLDDLMVDGREPRGMNVEDVDQDLAVASFSITPGHHRIEAPGDITAVVWSVGVDRGAYDGYSFSVGW